MQKIFKAKGLLQQFIPNFSYRDEQLQMAEAVANTIEKQQTLIVEAGTGTGKTFAYLIPALKAKHPVLISTGSKTLQDQLYHRDLPMIKKLLNYHGNIVLLKGRANYLCLERLQQVIITGVLLDANLLADLTKIRKWQQSTKTGDFSECKGVSEKSPIFEMINSNHDSCNLNKHPNCYLSKLRKKALNADLIIVNHHLFFADMSLKEQGYSELIPSVKTYIFDEAHQLPDIANQYFSETLSSKALINLSQELQILYRTELSDVKQLDKASELLKKMAQETRLAMEQGANRGELSTLLQQPLVIQRLEALLQALDFSKQVIISAETRTQVLTELLTRVEQYISFLTKLNSITNNQHEYCYWYETYTNSFNLNISPISIADKFNLKLVAKPASWIFTSATITVDHQVDYFCHRLGIQEYQSIILNSPFNYQQQALLYVPRNLPRINNTMTAEKLIPCILPLIETNQGRCFLLCTSYNIMHKLAELLQQHATLNILLQGSLPKMELLAQFIQQKNSVLIATYSFWEGIDIKGEALSLVIIDKLPFNAPNDPVLKARIEQAKHNGIDPFNTIQLPEAVISLKQGTGRLIRDIHDKGVIVICDPRLVGNRYGKVFLTSLPNTLRTRNLDKTLTFLSTK